MPVRKSHRVAVYPLKAARRLGEIRAAQILPQADEERFGEAECGSDEVVFLRGIQRQKMPAEAHGLSFHLIPVPANHRERVAVIIRPLHKERLRRNHRRIVHSCRHG